MNQNNTDIWDLYEKSKDYKRKLDLYEVVDKTERFYSGDQWNGVVSNGLPTPVFNVHKRVINYFISAMLSQAVKMQFSPEDAPEDSQDPKDQYAKMASEIVNDQCAMLWERLKMDSNMRQALLDAALSGDMDGYTLWNPDIDPGQDIGGVAVEGDLDFELIDNVNIHFGNPNDRRVEAQPWIIVSFRQLVANLKEEAEKNGAPQEEIDRISGDTDYQEQSGDRSKIEMEATGGDAKTTALIKFWKDPKTKTIWYKKATKDVAIVPDTDMGLSRYPVAHANWDKRKNSYHGQSVGYELIPNQIFINKMFAMVMLNLMNVAFPKAVYNKSIIPNWSNQIGQAIGVEGGDDINRVARYLEPGNMSSQVMQVIDAAINYTKDLVGAGDANLGEIKPDNHSAIIAVQQAGMIPLENIKANLYQWVEDFGNIWFDFMACKYGIRKVLYKNQVITFDFGQLKALKMKLKIDVGPSSYWSEITAAQTLDNLLQQTRIDFMQYLERMPDGYIPQKQELIEDLKKAAESQQPPAPPPPTTSISFKDLPINGRIQLAAQHGIQLTAQDFVEDMQLEAQLEIQKQQQKLLQQFPVQTPVFTGQPPQTTGGIT